MQSHGLIDEEIELRADRVSRGDKNVCELVIDDFMQSLSFQTPTMQWLAPVVLNRGCSLLRRFTRLKVCLAQLRKMFTMPVRQRSQEQNWTLSRALGIVTSWQKRISLAFPSLQLSRLRWISDNLHLCLLAGWFHSFSTVGP